MLPTVVVRQHRKFPEIFTDTVRRRGKGRAPLILGREAIEDRDVLHKMRHRNLSGEHASVVANQNSKLTPAHFSQRGVSKNVHVLQLRQYNGCQHHDFQRVLRNQETRQKNQMCGQTTSLL
eukprot:1281708-Rhodomonas_salina.1